MNKTRRKRIDEIILQAEALQLSVDELKEEIEVIKDEEEEYMDNIPENLQGPEKYAAAEEAVNNLEVAIDWLEEICTDELTGLLSEAKVEN